MENNDKNKIVFNVRVFFVIFIVACLAQILFAFGMKFYVRNKMQDTVEKELHRVDSVYAHQYEEALKTGSSSKLVYSENEDCFIAVIDSDGNVLDSRKGTNINFNVANVLKLLYSSKIIGDSYERVATDIVNSGTGRVEFYSANQSKILVYTPVSTTGYSVVRVIPKKIFMAMCDDASNQVGVLAYGVIALAIVMFIIVHLFSKYATGIETNNERHNMIAADNDLISFTYHPSIASFEMTGAVNKIFGNEIGKRSQVDWNSLSQLLHPDDQTLLRNMSKAIKTGETKYTTEFRMISPSGDYHWYRLNGKSILGESGEHNKFVGTIQNSDDQITHENMLKNKAEHDLLTGLLNKITLEDSINEALKNASHNAFSFFIVDLDNFKAVNDNLGHATGDKVLTDVASKLQLVFNEADYIGRLGGDEFAVLLVIPSMMVSQAEKLTREKANLLNELLRAEYGDDKITIHVSASIGVATYPRDGMDFQTLYRNGDKALYHSKEHGKNQATFYSELAVEEK